MNDCTTPPQPWTGFDGCMRRVTGAVAADAQALHYMLKYCAKAAFAKLGQGLLQAALAEDGIAPLAHDGQAVELIVQAQFLQGGNDVHELPQPLGGKGAVDLPALVADAHHHDVPAGAAKVGIALGRSLHGGEYFLVIGAGLYPIDALDLHIGISKEDVLWMKKAIAAFEESAAPGSLGKRTAQEIWDAARARLLFVSEARLPVRSELANCLVSAVQGPGGVFTVVTSSRPSRPQTRVVARTDGSDFREISLAAIALDAGWQLGALSRNGLGGALR